MVNYCCVEGCGRNSKQSKHLTFYSIPKERNRQILWLKAANREDLLEKDQTKLNHRFCSRHFSPVSIKNKHLCDDATPSLYLYGENDEEIEVIKHKNIVCNNCEKLIVGFRYKCIICKDYDLCQKCEMMETHSEHYVLRIPKPLKFKQAAHMSKKLKKIFKSDDNALTIKENDSISGSSDDEPITKYRSNGDNDIQLSDRIKNIIKNEVSRVIHECEKICEPIKKNKKRKKRSTEGEVNKRMCDREMQDSAAPELVFADVNADFDMKYSNADMKEKDEDIGSRLTLKSETRETMDTKIVLITGNKL